MAKAPARVFIPRNPSELLSLAESIYTKHKTDGANSPLNQLEDDNWTENGAKITKAKALDAQAKQMQKDLENLFKQRDLLLAPINATIKASRNLLLSKYSRNPKKLGDWSFDVTDSPKAKKAEKKAA